MDNKTKVYNMFMRFLVSDIKNCKIESVGNNTEELESEVLMLKDTTYPESHFYITVGIAIHEVLMYIVGKMGEDDMCEGIESLKDFLLLVGVHDFNKWNGEVCSDDEN